MTGDDEEDDAPRGLFTPLYWLVVAAGLALTLLGGAIGLFGSRSPHRAAPPVPPTPALTGAGAHGRGAGPIPRL